MMKFVAKTRDAAGTSASKALRREDLVPGVVYASDLDPIKISMERPDVEKIERDLGTNSVFELEIEGQGSRTVFLREISRAAIKPIVYNISLQAIKKGEKLEVNVPVSIVGEEKLANPAGVAAINVYEVTLRIDPAKAPEYFTVDVSGLDINDSVTAGEVKFEGMEDAELITDPEEVIVSVSAPDDEPEEDTEPAAAAEPEVIGEKDSDEE